MSNAAPWLLITPPVDGGVQDGILTTVHKLVRGAQVTSDLTVAPSVVDQDKGPSGSPRESRGSASWAAVFPFFANAWGIQGPEVFPTGFRWGCRRCGRQVGPGYWAPCCHPATVEPQAFCLGEPQAGHEPCERGVR